ncbi:MAG: hypothetical protein H0W78_16110 [Planctomycetes bacterium]|jgi:hypothetical protein|nr:hypothetical protein [Planctomycetota bacterium]
MATTMDRKKLLKVVKALPDDCSLEDAVYRIQVWAAIEEGLESLRKHGGIPHDVVVARLKKKWSRRRSR